jgi:hypothetical protein
MVHAARGNGTNRGTYCINRHELKNTISKKYKTDATIVVASTVSCPRSEQKRNNNNAGGPSALFVSLTAHAIAVDAIRNLLATAETGKGRQR